jgi:hypothetical protein
LPAVLDVTEVFSSEEVRPRVLDTPFNPGFVAGMAHPGRIHHETPGLGVLAERVIKPRIGGIRVVDDRFHVVRHHNREHAPEEDPRGLEPSHDVFQCLAQRRIDEHVPRVDRREDQPLSDPAPPGGRLREQPEPTEVDLNFLTWLAISDPHGRLSAAESELGHREPVQRPIRHHHTATTQQHVDLGQRQVLLQPHRDLLALPGDRLPRRTITPRPIRADHAHHRTEQLLGQLAVTAPA